jgi:hypothetical protein
VVAPLLSPEQVAELTGLHISWVYRHRVELGFTPMGHGERAPLRTTWANVEAWMQQQREARGWEAPPSAAPRPVASRGPTSPARLSGELRTIPTQPRTKKPLDANDAPLIRVTQPRTKPIPREGK